MQQDKYDYTPTVPESIRKGNDWFLTPSLDLWVPQNRSRRLRPVSGGMGESCNLACSKKGASADERGDCVGMYCDANELGMVNHCRTLIAKFGCIGDHCSSVLSGETLDHDSNLIVWQGQTSLRFCLTKRQEWGDAWQMPILLLSTALL
jgi:hypothetical protein